MGVLTYIEIKRIGKELGVFFLTLLVTALIGLLLIIGAENFLPKALSVEPFVVGICAENPDAMTKEVLQYLERVEEQLNIISFASLSAQEGKQKMQAGEISAYIYIPEHTGEKILQGEKAVAEVYLRNNRGMLQQQSEKAFASLLTDAGMRLIDLPQAQTLILQEHFTEDIAALAFEMDVYDASLFLDRDLLFEQKKLPDYAWYTKAYYYKCVFAGVLLLFWGIGFWRTEKDRDGLCEVLLEMAHGQRRFSQKSFLARELAFLIPFILPAVWICIALHISPLGAIFLTLVSGVRCHFFARLFHGKNGGMVLFVLWNLVALYFAGGIVPALFLQEKIFTIGHILPAGIIMDGLLYDVYPVCEGLGYVFFWVVAGYLVSLLRRRRVQRP